MAKQNLSDADKEQLKKDLVEIQQLAVKLGDTSIDINSLQDVEKEYGNIRRILKSLREEWQDYNSDISISSQAFRESVQELSNSNIALGEFRKNYRGLISIADQLQSYQRGYTELTEKDIERFREKIALSKQSLINSREQLKTDLADSTSNKDSLKNQFDALEKIIAQKKKNGESTSVERAERRRITSELNREESNHKKISKALQQNTALIQGEDEAFKDLNIRINETYRQIKEDFISNIDESFKKVVNEMQTTEDSTKKIAKSFSTMATLGQKIQDHQHGITELTEKELKSISEKLESERKNIVYKNELLKSEKAVLEAKQKSNEENIKIVTEEVEKEEERLKIEEKSRKLTDKDYEVLKKLQEKRDKELETRKDINQEIELNGTLTAKIQDVVNGTDENYNKLSSTIAKINDQLKQQKDLLGLGGAAIGGLSTALNKLGFGQLSSMLGVEDAQKQMDDLAKQIVKDREQQLELEKEISEAVDARTGEKLSPEVLAEKQKQLGVLQAQNAQYNGMGGKLSILKKGFSAMGESLKKSLGPLALISMAIEEIIDAMKILDSGAGDMAKSMNMTYSEALKTREELGTIADLSGDAAVQTKDLQESLMAVGKALGSNAKLNEADLVTMTKLTKQAGFTHDELMGMQKLSLTNGKSLEDNTKEVLGSAKAHASMRGLMINEKDVLREVNKMSASLKLSLGGSADKMAEAVVKTKALGLSIEQAEKMADGLLQFESSISSEMEAEMLTGKALNFEKARLLALNNDVAGAAEEIAKQVGTSADFTKMNRIQQEALAKAAGMTRDELAQSLMDREALAALSGKEGETAKMAFDRLVKEVGMEEAKKRLGNEELARQYEQQSVQERFNQTVEKLKEVFVRIAEPLMGILDPIMEIVETIMPLVNVLLFPLMTQIKAMGKYISTFISEPFKAIKEVIGGIIDIFSGDFSQGLEKLGKGLLRSILTPVQAIMNAGISVINSAISLANKIPGVKIGEVKDFNLADSIMGDDVVSKAGYGERTLLSPEGAIKLNNNDTVIAGTKLLDDPNKQFQQQPSIEAPQSSSIFSKILQSVTAPISMMSKGAQSILGSVLPSSSDESSSVLLDVKNVLISIHDIISKGINPGVIEKVKTSESSSLATNASKEINTLNTDSNKISATADFTQMNRVQQEALATVNSTTDKSKDSSIFTSLKETLFKISPILGLASKLFSTEDKSKETIDKSKEIVSLVSSQNDKTKELSTQASTETKKESTLDKIKESVSSALSTSSESKDSSIFTSIKDTLLKLSPALSLASKLFSTENITDKSKENISSLTSSSIASLTDKTKSTDLTKNINVSNADDTSKIDAKSIDKSNVSNLNTLVSSSISDAVKSTETNKTSSLNAVSALNKADLSNLIVNAENVSVVESKTSEENKSSILDIFNPIKMISKITDLFTGKSENETTKANLAESSLTKINLTDSILNTAANTKNITSADKTKSSLLAVNNIADTQSENTATKTEFNKLEEELLTGKKTNELVATSIDNLKVANLIVEKQTEEKTDNTKGAITGAVIGSFLGPLGALAGGLIGEMFSETNEEEITPISNETQMQSQTITSPNNNVTTSTSTNNNQTITSDENVIKILQEAVAVLKAIQAKDTSVQLALDGDVIARKITPNINREQVKTYSNIS